MRFRFATMAVALLLGGVLTIASGPPVDAAAAQPVGPRIRIAMIFYDSPGVDTRANESLTAEWIVLRNASRDRINLYRWTVSDAHRHVYRFNSTFFLGAGASVVLHTGAGTNTISHRYWNQRDYVWDNTADTAYVYGPTGRLVYWCGYRGLNDQKVTGASARC